jgi:hypothetical protein
VVNKIVYQSAKLAFIDVIAALPILVENLAPAWIIF